MNEWHSKSETEFILIFLSNVMKFCFSIIFFPHKKVIVQYSQKKTEKHGCIHPDVISHTDFVCMPYQINLQTLVFRVEGGRGGLNLLPPVPFTPASRIFYSPLLPLSIAVFFTLSHSYCEINYWKILLVFSRFPSWESRSRPPFSHFLSFFSRAPAPLPPST